MLEQYLLPDNQNFNPQNLPTTPKGTAKVDNGRGIKVNYIWYWTDQFRLPEMLRTSVPVRYNPEDVSVVYAFINQQWVRCHSEQYDHLKGHSMAEIQSAIRELRGRRHGNHLVITGYDIANFIDTNESDDQ